MPEPILIIHGVANHETEPFLENVRALQEEMGDEWQLIPVFWGDLGGKSVDIADCLPTYESGNWQVRSIGGGTDLPPIGPKLGSGLLNNEERARILMGNKSLSVRSLSTSFEQQEIAEELSRTNVLQYIDDLETLTEVRTLLEPVLAEEGTSQVRGLLGNSISKMISSIDAMLGKVLGNNLGIINQRLRSAIAVPFSQFFGDIIVYEIQSRENPRPNLGGVGSRVSGLRNG